MLDTSKISSEELPEKMYEYSLKHFQAVLNRRVSNLKTDIEFFQTKILNNEMLNDISSKPINELDKLLVIEYLSFMSRELKRMELDASLIRSLMYHLPKEFSNVID